MRKIKQLLAVLAVVVCFGLKAQTEKTFKVYSYVFTQDSIAGFDEESVKSMATQYGVYGNEFINYMYIKKRAYVKSKYNLRTTYPKAHVYNYPVTNFNAKLSSVLASSGACNNEDFEDAQSNPGPQTSGPVNGWTLYESLSGANFCSPSALGAVVHFTVYNAPTADSQNGFPISSYFNAVTPGVQPSGNCFIRLNDASAGAKTVRLSKTYTISPSNAVFRYAYIGVFSNPGHPCCDQPGMTINVTITNTTTGASTLLACPNITIAAGTACGPAQPGYSVAPGTGDYYTPNWMPGALDLSPYIGSAVTLDVYAVDCNYGGHYGYVYFDALCQPSTIIGNGNSFPAGSTNITIPTCGASGATITAPPALGPYSWTSSAITITPSSLSVPNQTNTTLITNQSGTVMLTMTPPGACAPINKVLTVTITPSPQAVISVTNATCSNTLACVSVTALGSASVSPSVSWVPGAPTSSSTSGNLILGCGFPVGPGTIQVFDTYSCMVSQNFTITPAPPTPTFALLATNYSLTCYNPSATLSLSTTYSSPSTITWLNAASSFSSNANPVTLSTNTAVSVYTVSLADNSSPLCKATQTFAIGMNTVAPTNTLSGSSFTLNCTMAAPTITNTIITPTANASTTWAWTTPAPSTTGSVTNAGNVSLFSPIPGTITVMSCNTSNGCCNSKTITVTSTSAYPTFNPASSTNFTLGCSPVNTTTLYANNASSPGFPLTYTFIPPTASPSPTIPLPPSAVTATAPSFTTSIPGTWTIVVMDGVSKCQTAIPVTVIQNTFAPPASYSTSIPTQTLTCYNSTFAATGASTNSNTTIQWLVPVVPNTYANPTVPIGILATGPATAITAMSNYATYTLQVIDNNNKCITTQTMQVMQSFRPPINLLVSATSSVLTCAVQQTQLGITTSGTGPWYVGSGPAGPPTWVNPPSSSMSPSVVAINETVNLAPATYTAYVQDGFNGCIGTFTRTILQNIFVPQPTASIAVIPCGSSTAVAKVTIVLSNTLTSWNIKVEPPLNGAQLSNPALTGVTGQSVSTTGGVSQYSFTINQPGVYPYNIVNNSNGCMFSPQPSFTVVTDSLHPSFSASTLQGFAPLPVTFTNTTGTNSGSGTITSVWSFGNGNSNVTTGSNASTTYLNPGTYTVVLTSTSGTCNGSSYKVIVVDIPSSLTIPNVFTPNGDNVNDVFFVKASNLTDINALIFDRWGNVVYQLDSNTGNISWDGKNQYGKDCAEGTYFYVIKATGKDGTSYEKKGNVSLFR
ncbi:MAG: gliding motility-associated C-terminal domain-containing protein [Bacteroidetes bacterium]|nr:gliding motility-associated C-terminal domain-containing protein [Bacteroidota bacterium]